MTVERLAIRHALLHDFLVETGSELPAFDDARVVDAGAGLRIGPTSVDTDFLGSPVVRAHVINTTGREVDALVVVTLEDDRGGSARASTWIEQIAPHGERSIELYCPNTLSPKSVRWSVTPM